MRSDSEKGNVAIEFITIAVFLMIPLCYLAIACASVVSEYLVVNSAARNGARAFVIRVDDQAGRMSALNEVHRQLAAENLSGSEFSMNINCTAHPCLTPDSYVTVRLTGQRRIELPLLGSVRIPISATQTLAVDSLR